MIKKNRRVYKKPQPKEKATVYVFNDNKQFDIVIRKHPKTTKISEWVRIAGNKMRNVITGEERNITQKEKRKASSAFGGLKVSYRVIKNTFKGKGNEYIYVFEFSIQVTDINQLKKEIKSIIEKLKRRFGEIIFIRVLLYKEEHQPIIHIWVKKVDGTEIETTTAELETLWKNGKVTIIKVTKNNIESLASYFCNQGIHKELYPTGIKVWSPSTNIEEIETLEDIDYEQAEEIVKGCKQTYGKSLSFTDSWTNQEIQQITYESYNRPQEMKLRKVPTTTTKYKGTILKDYKKKQEEQVDKNFAEIEKLTTGVKWFKVEILDQNLCQVIFKNGNTSKQMDTQQALRFVKYLLNKNKFLGGNKNDRKRNE